MISIYEILIFKLTCCKIPLFIKSTKLCVFIVIFKLVLLELISCNGLCKSFHWDIKVKLKKLKNESKHFNNSSNLL